MAKTKFSIEGAFEQLEDIIEQHRIRQRELL